jgi:hypothetical protein
MGGRNKVRAVFAAAAACAALVAAQVSPAYAAAGGIGHTVTMTENVHGTWTEPGDTDFCTNETVTPRITGNSVLHVTFFPRGDEAWGTFTETGKASFLQPSTGLTFSGRVTVWGNFNVNNKNSNSTFTANFSLSAVDSLGVTHYEVGHQVAHIGYNAVDPSSPIVSFEKMSVTCS